MRICIFGGPGSGKTYLAKKTSKELKIKHYDLDNIFWDKKDIDYSQRARPKDRNKDFKKILKNKSWIIEGVYFRWNKESFSKADKIIILQTNTFIRDFRIISRFIKNRLGLLNIKKLKFKETKRLLFWNHKFEKVDLPKAKRLIKSLNKNVVIVKNIKRINFGSSYK
jgi:adenylate kinase family enzyme